jgi:hypothetical protein
MGSEMAVSRRFQGGEQAVILGGEVAMTWLFNIYIKGP